jgi:hypothetical protein
VAFPFLRLGPIGLPKPRTRFQKSEFHLQLQAERLQTRVSLNSAGDLKRPVGQPTAVQQIAHQQSRVDLLRRQGLRTFEQVPSLAPQTLLGDQAQLIAVGRLVARAIGGQNLVPAPVFAELRLLGLGRSQRQGRADCGKEIQHQWRSTGGQPLQRPGERKQHRPVKHRLPIPAVDLDGHRQAVERQPVEERGQLGPQAGGCNQPGQTALDKSAFGSRQGSHAHTLQKEFIRRDPATMGPSSPL